MLDAVAEQGAAEDAGGRPGFHAVAAGEGLGRGGGFLAPTRPRAHRIAARVRTPPRSFPPSTAVGLSQVAVPTTLATWTGTASRGALPGG